MMTFDEVINKRYSCREFKDTKIKKEEIDYILKAANLAPTAKNKQPIKILVIEDENTLNKLKEATPCTFNAKTVFVICHDRNKCWIRSQDSKYHGDIDASIVTTFMMLASTSLGIGSTYVCAFNESILKEVLNLDDNLIPTSILPVGYPLKDGYHNTRKDINEIVEYR